MMDQKNSILQRLSTIRLKSWVVFWVVAIVCVIFFWFQLEYNTHAFSEPKITTTSPNKQGIFMKVPEAQNRSTVSGAAFAFLALGAQAYQKNCDAAIESLVRFGGWDGDVYLITDRKTCFNPKKIIENAGMNRHRFHYIIVGEDFSHGGIDFSHPKVGARKSRVRSFEMKTRLFDFIRDPNIHTIAYVDCDVLFGLDGCAKDMVTAGPSWDNKEENVNIKITRAVYNEQNHDLEDIHAGSFVVHRERSKEVLRLWREQLGMRQTEGDNDAFMIQYNRQKELFYNSTVLSHGNLRAGLINATATSNNYSHGNMTTFRNPMEPTVIFRHGLNERSYRALSKNLTEAEIEDRGNRFEKFSSAILGDVKCINHISKARCERYGRKKFQRFVDQFHLKTYNPGEAYCASPWLKPFQYGWVPLGYLPGCPKLETFL